MPTPGRHPTYSSPHAPPSFTPYGGPTLQPGATNSNDVRQWQRGNIRTPPAWGPEVQAAYPFRHWVHDVMSWSIYTDLRDEQKGPAVELVLAGTARDLVREILLDHKSRGAMGDLGDGQGPRHFAGLELIVRLLNAHFAHMDDEEASRQLMEMYTFRRRPGETMDAYIARYTVMSHRVASLNGVTVGPGQRAFFLMAGTGFN